MRTRHRYLLTATAALGVIVGRGYAAEVVVTGKPVDVNGQTTIPKALLGVHTGYFQGYDASVVQEWGIESQRSMPSYPSKTMSPESGIDDLVVFNHDRFVPPLVLDRPGSWQTDLEELAREHADASASMDVGYHIEFWNEPYLNWGYKPGSVTDPQFYEREGVSDGDAVYIRGASEPCEYLVWKDNQIWFDSPRWAADKINVYNSISGVWNYLIHNDPDVDYSDRDGLRKYVGTTFKKGSSREFTVIETIRPVDTTQTSYYSARQASVYYNRMYGVFAQKVREFNQDIRLVAGWGFNMHMDDWTPWETLVKPLIDEHHDLIDGINEHHYHTDPRIVAADYETVYGYANRHYGKRYRFYNTETGGYVDPQASGQGSSPTDGLSDAEKGMYAFTYHTRDILYMMSRVPDKAFSRAAHEPQKSFGGVETAFTFLKPLRGELVQAESSDNDIWSVAALNGQSLVVALFSDNTVAKTIELTVRAPSGRSLDGGQRRQATIDGGLSIESASLPAGGAEYTTRLTLEPMSPVLLSFQLAGSASGDTPVYYTQFFADTVLMHVEARSSAATTISVPQTDLAGAASARLRYVLAGGDGSETMSLNGRAITLSPGTGIRYAPLDPAHLSADNRLTLTAGSQPVRLWSAAIELISDEAPVIASSRPVHKTASTRPMAPRIAVDGTVIRIRRGVVDEPLRVALYDMTGRLIRTRTTTGDAVSFDDLGAGSVIVRIAEGDRVVARRAVMLVR